MGGSSQPARSPETPRGVPGVALTHSRGNAGIRINTRETGRQRHPSPLPEPEARRERSGRMLSKSPTLPRLLVLLLSAQRSSLRPYLCAWWWEEGRNGRRRHSLTCAVHLHLRLLSYCVDLLRRSRRQGHLAAWRLQAARWARERRLACGWARAWARWLGCRRQPLSPLSQPWLACRRAARRSCLRGQYVTCVQRVV
jgi:hypothetical protein